MTAPVCHSRRIFGTDDHSRVRTFSRATVDVQATPVRTTAAQRIVPLADSPESPSIGPFSIARLFRASVLALLASVVLVGTAQAQTPESSVPAITDSERIERLEQALQALAGENRRLSGEVRDLQDRVRSSAPTERKIAAPLSSSAVVPLGLEDAPPVTEDFLGEAIVPSLRPVVPASGWQNRVPAFEAGYDNGFTIASKDPEDTPFSLKINSQNVFRLNEFARDEDFWIDSAGNQNQINDSNSFQIPRGRLIFSGNALLPDLTYLLNIDYNSVTSNPIGFRAYELGYRFSRGFAIHVGQSKVPGTREWLESGFAPLEGPDRTMATTFFRPSLSQGVWISGEPLDGLHYIAMMSNGFNTLNVSPSQLTNRFCWSSSTWWEPWGEFGRGYADLENHQEPVMRLGACYTFALGGGSQSDSGGVENSSIRLSDGTLITQTGAFAPGVTLQSYDISLATVDLAFKYRGCSLSTEFFAQNLSSLEGNGPLPLSSTQAYGGFLQGGWFLRPQEVEIYARESFVTGDYGSGTESAGGVNWFLIPGQSNLRFTFDTAWLESSPASQNRTGFVAGQTGLLIRTQITATY